MTVESEFQFSADPQKAIFAGEMYGSLFVSGQQYHKAVMATGG